MCEKEKAFLSYTVNLFEMSLLQINSLNIIGDVRANLTIDDPKFHADFSSGVDNFNGNSLFPNIEC